ncbi:MAG: hypothetical protein IKL08_05950 [Clostridia bacterium]|nr:hypothetical protein [Clostridia bacterium]
MKFHVRGEDEIKFEPVKLQVHHLNVGKAFEGKSLEEIEKEWDYFQKRFGHYIYDEMHEFEPDERLVRTIKTSPKKLIDEHALFKHRLEMINEYIESRKENMLPEHYDDLKYIANECDLESSW